VGGQHRSTDALLRPVTAPGQDPFNRTRDRQQHYPNARALTQAGFEHRIAVGTALTPGRGPTPLHKRGCSVCRADWPRLPVGRAGVVAAGAGVPVPDKHRTRGNGGLA
jgi:hypothetical protein